MKTVTSTLSALWRTSPAEWVAKTNRRVRRRLGEGDHGWDYSLDVVLKSDKHMNPRLEIERWERLWRLCALNGSAHLQREFDVSRKTVLEVGCGPVFGCGPMVLFRGADRFFYQEPDLRRAVVESDAVKARYFRPLYEELVANYGHRLEFADWYQLVMDQSVPLPTGTRDEIDITVSQAVLEHVPRAALAPLLRDWVAASRPGGRFWHSVDFGSHGRGDGTMASLYLMNRDEEPEHLNLLRQPDIEVACRDAGLDVEASLVYKADDLPDTPVHESWRQYSRRDLSARVVHLIGRRSAAAERLASNATDTRAAVTA